MADAPAWAKSEAAPAWVNSPAEPTAPAWSDAAPASAQPEPEKPTVSGLPHWAVDASKSVIDTAASIPRNVAAVGDMALGLPAMVAKMGQTGVTDVIAAVKGDPHPLQSATDATEDDWADEHFLQAPLQTTFGYDPEKTVVGHLMGKFGKAVDTAVENETTRTGDPERGALLRQVSNIVMMKAGDLVVGTLKGANKGVKAIARKRMAETTPTGAAPKPEWVTPKGVSESTPIESREIVGKKKRMTPAVTEESPISDPSEGDLGPLPPIEAYEPSPEVHQDIHEILSDPYLHTGHPESVEAARDVAAEKVKASVTADRFKQAGGANKAVLGYLGTTAAGAAAGAYLNDDPIKGAFEGAGAGFAMARIGHVLHDYGAGASLRDALDVVKPSVDPMRKAAADVNNAKVANVKAKMRDIGAIQRAYMKAVPDKARREHITHVVQSGDYSSLTPKELYFVKLVEKEYARMGSAAQQAGVIGRLIGKDYVPMMWDFKDASTKAFFDELLESGAGDAASAGAFTPHSLKRSIDTYLQGMSGDKFNKLKPLTLDHAELLGLYANSVIKATENANALYTLKSMKLPNGHYAVEPIGKGMPKDYITEHNINGLEGFAVHPEMVDALRRGFDSYKPGAIQKAMLAVSFAAKRLAVSYSLFHPMSLLVAYTGAGGNPFGFVAGAAARGVEKASGGRIKIPFKSAVDAAREQYLKAGAGDVADFAIRNGLEIGTTIEDTVGRDSFLKMTGAIDKVLGSDVTGLKPFTAADEGVHQFTWGYLHTGMKLETFGREFEKALADPKNAGKDVNQIAADTASYVNNIYGGLNWDRVVEGMRSKFGKSMAGAAYSKHGRAVLQTVAFAPDWLMSTMRSWIQAVPGVGENAAVGKLHRAYLARSIMYTMAITDALNLYYSGHHVWENDFRSQRKKEEEGDERPVLDTIHDMTFIDMGDGTKVEGNKHLFEFAHAMTEPSQFAMGKLSSTVTDPLNMAMNRQWLSPTWSPKISEGGTAAEKSADYAKWLLAHHAPISLQQLGEGSYGGTFGFPRHGKTEEEKATLRQKTKELKQERGL